MLVSINHPFTTGMWDFENKFWSDSGIVSLEGTWWVPIAHLAPIPPTCTLHHESVTSCHNEHELYSRTPTPAKCTQALAESMYMLVETNFYSQNPATVVCTLADYVLVEVSLWPSHSKA
jgi:hypothetical protein